MAFVRDYNSSSRGPTPQHPPDMNTALTSPNALASSAAVIEAADSFSAIAESLHHSLRAMSDQLSVPTEKAYALITEEYGLRTRLGILRGDAKNRVVIGVTSSQDEFLDLLSSAGQLIRTSRNIDEVAQIVITISALCVSIFPGKQVTVNFLVDRLRAEIRR
jgi:hypothetical protein